MVFNVTFEEIFGAGGGIFQEKTVMPGAQEQEVVPDEGCDALSKVTVAGDEDLIAANIRKNVEIFGVTGTCEAAGILQVKVARSSSSDQDVEADAGYAGLSKVTVQGDANLVASNIKKDVEILGVVGTYDNRLPEQVKTATPAAAGVEVLPDEGKTLSRVNIPAEPDLVPGKIKAGENIFGVVGEYETPTEEKSVSPGAQEQEIIPASGKHLSKVIVAGDADLVAGNIKKGVNIFDVVGTMEGQKEEQVKTVDADPAGLEVVPDTGKALSKVIINAIANLIASNIKKDITILGVTGTYEPTVETQEKSATPGAQAVEVTPDAGKYLSKVIVSGDADLVAGNIKKNVEIFGVTGTYEGTETNFLSFIENDTGMIVLPEGLTSIRQSCFKYDSHQFTLPESLVTIGSYAFSGCTGMTSLSIPNNVTMIDMYAFDGCKNIEGSITIPAGVNEIAGSSWYGCNKITEFIIKAPFTAARYNRIQAYAFNNCSACLRYDFTAAEAVPELVNINAFNNHNADLRIIVPDALYNDWIAATNWSNSNISEHIIKKSEEV